MVALYERPDLKKRNQRILELFKAGELSRKEIAAKEQVSADVVNNIIKAARAEHKKKSAHRRCRCGSRRA